MLRPLSPASALSHSVTEQSRRVGEWAVASLVHSLVRSLARTMPSFPSLGRILDQIFYKIGRRRSSLDEQRNFSLLQLDDEEDATAGMVLSVLGTELRPYVFFRGNGELMSHVFAGTASDHTPALQGNFLLMDHMQLVPLLNGLIVQLQLKGCVSIDLGGSVQISLWNRYERGSRTRSAPLRTTPLSFLLTPKQLRGHFRLSSYCRAGSEGDGYGQGKGEAGNFTADYVLQGSQSFERFSIRV